jgi:hypothetical protein
LNHSHSFSIGDQRHFWRPFGYVASLSYNKTDNFYQMQSKDMAVDSNIVNAGLNKQMYLTGASRESFGVLWWNFCYLASLNPPV